MFSNNNPVFNESTLARLDRPVGGGLTFSAQGAVTNTLILTSLCGATAIGGWALVENNPGLYRPIFWGSLIAGLALALIICFKPRTSPFLAPVYALQEGVFVGAASYMYGRWAEMKSAGETLGHHLVLQAGLLTIGILMAMLLAYKTGAIRATEKFKFAVVGATGGIAIFALVMLGLSLFGVSMPWFMGEGKYGWVGIGIAGFIVVIASMNLILDFDLIEQFQAQRAPKYMEWYAGFGLLTTLVWLYLSILRLLAMLTGRRE